MKLVSMNCPHCGGALDVAEGEKQTKCPFCDSKIILEQENRQDPSGNLQAGYDFEAGRLKAQQDMKDAMIAAEQARLENQLIAERRNRNRIWWILGWIFCFPIPLTIIIVRSKKLSTFWKVFLLILLWGFILCYGALSEDNPAEEKSVTGTVTEQNVTYAAETEDLFFTDQSEIGSTQGDRGI